MTIHAFERRETLLAIQDVHAALGDRVVLRGVDAAIRNIERRGVEQGQVVGVLGPSGSGKTTLLRILAGLAAPARGRVLVEGAPVRAGRVGVVFQRCPLLEHRTVLGNLVAAGGSRDAAARAGELLARFGLAARADAWPRELSGGERQRAAILQQLLCGHTYLVMDEPFSSLDPVHKAKACELILEVSRLCTRNTIVVVTHDIPEAIKVCDTLWLLGRERAPSGEPLPGSRIVETYDLIARELAWHEGIERTPRFTELVHEVTDRFTGL